MSQAPAPANLPAKRVEPLTPLVLVKNKMAMILKALPPEGQARFQMCAIAVAMKSDLSDCTPESVFSGIYGAARADVSLDPVLQEAALVPFTNHGRKEATLVLMYKGLTKLARRADPSLYLKTGTVWENDSYVLEEGLIDTFRITKRYWEKGAAPGRPLFSYCISKQEGGSPVLKVVPAQDGQRIAAGKGGDRPGKPWHDHFAAMLEKTAVRRAAKLWTLDPAREDSRRFQEALAIDERTEELGELVDVTAEVEEQPQAPQAALPDQEPAGTQMGEQLQAEAEGLPVQTPAGTARIGSTEPAKRGRPRKANGAPPQEANGGAPAAPAASLTPEHPGEGPAPAAPQTPATPPQPAPPQAAAAPATPTAEGAAAPHPVTGAGANAARATPEQKAISDAFKLALSQRGITPDKNVTRKLLCAVTGHQGVETVVEYVLANPSRFPEWTAAVQALTLEQIRQAVR
jgi:phage RecT family recombinase